jgi:hypothetical protein
LKSSLTECNVYQTSIFCKKRVKKELAKIVGGGFVDDANFNRLYGKIMKNASCQVEIIKEDIIEINDDDIAMAMEEDTTQIQPAPKSSHHKKYMSEWESLRTIRYPIA